MIERMMLRASDTVASGGDPFAAVKPDLIVGPILIGLVLNIWLYGMQLMQVDTYFRSNPRLGLSLIQYCLLLLTTGIGTSRTEFSSCARLLRLNRQKLIFRKPNGGHKLSDSIWVKALVLFLLLADTVNSVFDVWFTYDYCVKKFGDKAAIMNATWVFNTDPVMTVIVSSTVQSFFAWRVRKLTGQTWLAVLIGLSAIAQFCAGMGVGIACGIVKEFTQFHRFKTIVMVWLVLAPITDIAISVALVWFLKRSKTGFAVTDDLVGKIARLTIQTGVITAVWATVDLILFLCWANNLHLLFNMPLEKLYSNCLMSTLNARHQWAGLSYTSGDHPMSGKGDTRGATHVTTATGAIQETYQMEPRGRLFGSPVLVGGIGVTSIKRKPIDDGLSFRSDSIISDSRVEDTPANRRKLGDGETRPASKQFPALPGIQVQADPQTGRCSVEAVGPNYLHPYVNVSSPAAPSTVAAIWF